MRDLQPGTTAPGRFNPLYLLPKKAQKKPEACPLTKVQLSLQLNLYNALSIWVRFTRTLCWGLARVSHSQRAWGQWLLLEAPLFAPRIFRSTDKRSKMPLMSVGTVSRCNTSLTAVLRTAKHPGSVSTTKSYDCLRPLPTPLSARILLVNIPLYYTLMFFRVTPIFDSGPTGAFSAPFLAISSAI